MWPRGVGPQVCFRVRRRWSWRWLTQPPAGSRAPLASSPALASSQLPTAMDLRQPTPPADVTTMLWRSWPQLRPAPSTTCRQEGCGLSPFFHPPWFRSLVPAVQATPVYCRAAFLLPLPSRSGVQCVVLHEGLTPFSGHYKTLAKGFTSDEVIPGASGGHDAFWQSHDDSQVEECTQAAVLHHAGRNGYLLMYLCQ
jgi:hypothetical protein